MTCDADRIVLTPIATVLGEGFQSLPPKVQALHQAPQPSWWSGRAEVRRSTGLLANLIADMMRFPATSRDVPVSVSFETSNEVEHWHRDFAGSKFSSRVYAGRGAYEGFLVEQFGVIKVAVDLTQVEDRLHFTTVRWSLLSIPLPRILMPSGESYETEGNGRFHFNIEICAPLIGLIVAYRGWLNPDD